MENEKKGLHEHHCIKVDPKQSPCRLDQFLVACLPTTTRTKVQADIQQQRVYVDGKLGKCSYKVQPGDEIRIMRLQAPSKVDVVPEDLPLDIVYEDDDLMLVNKASSMVVHPGIGNSTGTLVHALLHHFKDGSVAPQTRFGPGLLHRIDKGTSGLLLVAKREVALRLLIQQFLKRTVKRRYTALVWGDLPADSGKIDLPLIPSKSDFRLVVGCSKEHPLGKHAVTHYEVVERLGYVTLVACRLETGRKHQIRAHFRHIGHPLFGDPKYGGDRVLKGQCFSKYKTFVQNCFRMHPYQFLHAKSLAFVHPTTQKEVSFEVALPKMLALILQRWRRYMGGGQRR